MKAAVNILAVLTIPMLLSASLWRNGDSGQSTQDDIRATIQKYLEGGSDKEAAWKKIEAYPLKPEEVTDLAKFTHDLLMKGPKHENPGKPSPLSIQWITGKEYKSKYFAYFTGEKEGGKKYPLYLIMHSGGGKRDHSDSAYKELTWWPKQKDAAAATPVCRTDESRNLHWNNEPNDRLVVAAIEEMCRSYPIDTNQVYLLGCSMGGWGGWTVGSLHADRVAAIVSHSGGIWLDNNPFPVANLRNVPVYVHHGGDENPKWASAPGPKPVIDLFNKWKGEYGGYEVTAVNKQGQGHCSSSAGERDAMMKWLLKYRRDPYPKKVIWKLDDWSLPNFYWLKIEKPKKGPSFVAEIKGNQIDIKAKKFSSGLTVFVNDKLVDMSKPVTVTVDGSQKFSGVVKPSLAALVDSLQAKKDLEMVFWGKISF